MNDLQLLDTHGPAAHPLRPAVLQNARTALLDEIREASAPTTEQPPQVPDPGRRRWAATPRRLALLAACAAGLALLSPSVVGPQDAQAVVLVHSAAPSFPLTPRSVPSDLRQPEFEKDQNFILARYDGAGADSVIILLPDEDDPWSVPDDAREATVMGRPAWLFHDNEHEPTVSLVWRDRDGDWVGVTGRGHYADAAKVEAFAATLQDRPQPVRLRLTIAPKGWSLDKYKSDRVATYSPDRDGNGRESLDVVVLETLSSDFAHSYGARDISTALVNGRQATIGRTDEVWVIEAQTAQGQPYSVLAPLNFTREQLVEVAGGVLYTA